MKVIVQKVKRASVNHQDQCRSIQKGLVLFVGVRESSTVEDAKTLAKKISNARIFEDESGKLNESVKNIDGEILSISQFTLYANVKKGNRPSFTEAAGKDHALMLYEVFNETLRHEALNVSLGFFGEHMDVELINDGPITLTYESEDGAIK